MIRILTSCLIVLLMLNITAFTQTAKPTPVSQKIDGYIFKNSDTVLLTESNVCNLDLRLLTLACNEIYARHGYTFKDKSLQNYFNNRKWYKIDAKYTGNLSDIELKNVDFIKKYEENFKKYEAGNDKGRIINNISNFDVNGDGKIDNIKYTVEKGNPGSMDTYTLTINGLTIKEKEGGVQRLLHIIDINENDTTKEIAIQEYGDSDYWHTSFYYYNEQKIISMGKIEGLCGTYKSLNGKGIVFGTTRCNILQTWEFKDEYRLTSKHLFEHVDKLYYLANQLNPNTPITVLKSIHLLESPNSKKVIVKLKIGEKVDIIGANNKGWCLLKTTIGKTGWLAVDKDNKVKELGIYAQQVFDCLWIAG